MKGISRAAVFAALGLWLSAGLAGATVAAEEDSGEPLVSAVRAFADAVLTHGRDRYGTQQTPLFVDGLEVQSLEPARWQNSGQTWVLSNFASQQPLFRLLDGLSGLTGEARYREAAEQAAQYALKHLQTPNGLLYWGGHLAWDLESERPVGQGADTHELKTHQPYFELMWRLDPQATRQLMETIWAGHVLDWQRLDYNRHANARKLVRPRWDAAFLEDIEVPFPAEGGHLSFANVTPPLLRAGTMLAVLGDDDQALTWTHRLLYRWQQGKDPHTGLCGGQLSYRAADRAQDALGHVHPAINEAKIVASYHQTSRYHHLPLAQMQAGEALIAAGGKRAEHGRRFIDWALADLTVYAQHSYDPDSGMFVARMTDGTPLRWQEAKAGYYVAESFAPLPPDGVLLWTYAAACRLGGEPVHWNMVRTIARALDLGDIGDRNGARALRHETDQSSWHVIYALLELHRATGDGQFLQLARRVGQNVAKWQTPSGLFPRPGRTYARTGDEVPLALLHLAAALAGQSSVLPPPTLDSRFFHCEYHGPLEPHQQKRDDKRTYDHLVYYGVP
jgi:pectate lyase